MAEFGTFTVLVALAASLWAATAAAVDHRRGEGARPRGAGTAVGVAAGALTVALATLVTLFLTRDFSVRYVAEYSDSQLPTAYTLAAVWAGQDGSLLLWGWMLGGVAVLVLRRHRRGYPELMPIVVLVMALVLVLLTGLVATVSNPFTRLGFVPADGAGLNPMLRNWGQLYHPPATFLGYVGFAVPFAFAVAALVTGRVDSGWLRPARVWMLASWLFLGIGILLGARWAYTELGWGGYWAWDPVENVSLLPWLTATAFLHGVALQERRGTMRIWNLSLAVATFALTLFATFLVRSGVASSVHAFAESSAGLPLLGAVVVTVITGAMLIAWRSPLLRSPRDVSPLSRERLVLLTNALLVAYTLAIFWGTLFPVISSTLRGRDTVVGAGFYETLSVPFAIVLLVLAGACPVVAWRRASTPALRRALGLPVVVAVVTGAVVAARDGVRHPVTITVLSLAAFAAATLAAELYRGTHANGHVHPRHRLPTLGRRFVRNPRRYGGLVSHVGVVLLIVGITLDVTYQSDASHTLAVGEQAVVGRYQFTLERIDAETGPTRAAVRAVLDVTVTDGRPAGSVVAERYLDAGQDQPRTRVGVRSLLREDIYVILDDVDVENQTAGFQVHLHPGLLWLWIGGGLLLLGGVWAMWPHRSGRGPEHDAVASREPDRLEAMVAEHRERMVSAGGGGR